VLITRTLSQKVSCDVLLLMRFGYKSHRWHYDYHESQDHTKKPNRCGFALILKKSAVAVLAAAAVYQKLRKGLRYPAAVVDD